MKKDFLILSFFFISIFAVFSLDSKYDFSKIDLKEIINNKQNKIVNGNIVESNYFYNYSSRINYEINCNREKLHESYMFFSSDDSESLYDFFKEYFSEYFSKSFKIILSSYYYSGDLILSYYMYFEGEPSYTIYTKYNKTNGFWGFGITYTDSFPLNKITPRNYSEYEIQAYENYHNYVYLEDYNVNPEDLRTGIIYYHNIEIPSSFKLTTYYEKPFFYKNRCFFSNATLVNNNDSKFIVKLICDDSLKNNESFLNMIFTINDTDPITIRDLLSNDETTIKRSKCCKFRIEGYLSQKDYEVIKDNFYIQIN